MPSLQTGFAKVPIKKSADKGKLDSMSSQHGPTETVSSMPHLAARAPYARIWRDRGLHTGRSLIEEIRRGIAAYPDTRLIFGSQERPAEVSIVDAYRDATRLASALASLGFKPGDVIVSQVPNWEEAVIVLLAALHLGLVYIPVVHIYGPTELAYVLRQSKARALVIPDRWRNIDFGERVGGMGDLPALEHIIVLGEGAVPGPGITWRDLMDLAKTDVPPYIADPDEVCMINFTSGTTSAPKGVLHTHHSMGAEVLAYPLFGEPDNRAGPMLNMTPGGHITAVITMLSPFITGESLIFMDQFDGPYAVELIQKHAATRIGGVPYHLTTVFDLLKDEPMKLVRQGLTGAAGVPPSLIERGARMGVAIVKTFGLTEFPTITASVPSDALQKRAYTDGRMLAGCDFRIVNDDGKELPDGERGEIIAIGPELFKGYLDPEANAEAFTDDGWFRTGDIGVRDAEGFLTIVDRKKDIIIRGGENIASREVENVLARHPSVLEAAAVAWPDASLGERVGVFLRLRAGMQIDLDAIRAHFADAGIARQKTPEYLVIVDDFPRTPLGKVLKTELRKQIVHEGKP